MLHHWDDMKLPYFPGEPTAWPIFFSFCHYYYMLVYELFSEEVRTRCCPGWQTIQAARHIHRSPNMVESPVQPHYKNLLVRNTFLVQFWYHGKWFSGIKSLSRNLLKTHLAPCITYAANNVKIDVITHPRFSNEIVVIEWWINLQK